MQKLQEILKDYKEIFLTGEEKYNFRIRANYRPYLFELGNRRKVIHCASKKYLFLPKVEIPNFRFFYKKFGTSASQFLHVLHF